MRARLRPIDPSYRTAPERTRQKAVTSLHGSRVMQCKQKGTRVTCTMRIQSSRQQRRARYDRCIRRSASVSPPWISFCAGPRLGLFILFLVFSLSRYAAMRKRSHRKVAPPQSSEIKEWFLFFSPSISLCTMCPIIIFPVKVMPLRLSER